MAGDIIFLNGTSSAGKTTLAMALQEHLPEFWLHVALDQFRDGMPGKYRGLNSPSGTSGSAGLNVVPRSGSNGEFTEICFGDTGKRMLMGMRRSMRAMADAGNNIIIDDILLESSFLCDYLQVFSGINVTFVGVRCPIEVINAREASRPGRFPGTAAGHLDVCHQHQCYDIEVDTARMSPAECADAVIAAHKGGRQKAFKKLAMAMPH